LLSSVRTFVPIWTGTVILWNGKIFLFSAERDRVAAGVPGAVEAFMPQEEIAV
jgi:hypothetical protein